MAQNVALYRAFPPWAICPNFLRSGKHICLRLKLITPSVSRIFIIVLTVCLLDPISPAMSPCFRKFATQSEFSLVSAPVLRCQLPEKIDEPCTDVLVEQVQQFVLYLAELAADLFAEPQRKLRMDGQEPLKVSDVERAKAHVVAVGLRELPVQVALLEGELPEHVALLHDLLDVLVAIVVHKTYLDVPLLQEIELVVVVGLKIDVLPLRCLDETVPDVQSLEIRFVQLAPQVIVPYEQHIVAWHIKNDLMA